MKNNDAALKHNLGLYRAITDVTPLILRDFVVMKEKIEFLLTNLSQALDDCIKTTDSIVIPNHGDDCDACIALRNIRLRYTHDLHLFTIHHRSTTTIFENSTKPNCINAAEIESYLSLSLTSRAIFDNVFRSAVLYMEEDIRTYNKYLLESLSSINGLKWSTIPRNTNGNIDQILVDYSNLSNRERNSSTLYSDPAPNFKSKVAYLRNRNEEPEFAVFFDDCEHFYNAFSDMVHGGAASLAASYPKDPQIAMGYPELRYVASAHQLVELIGITLIMSNKLLIQLYIPVLIRALAHVEGTAEISQTLRSIHALLSSKIEHFSF